MDSWEFQKKVQPELETHWEDIFHNSNKQSRQVKLGQKGESFRGNIFIVEMKVKCDSRRIPWISWVMGKVESIKEDQREEKGRVRGSHSKLLHNALMRTRLPFQSEGQNPNIWSPEQ